jgi:hypothetical protein
MDKTYAEICGITAGELTGNFDPELRALAENNKMTYDEALAEMQKRFNGYHFSEESEGMFNPFSVLKTIARQRFRYYWFQTATPTILVKVGAEIDAATRTLGRWKAVAL